MNTDSPWKRARFHLIVTSLIAAVLAAVLFVPQNAFAATAASPAAGAASAATLTAAQMKDYVYNATNQVRYNAGLTTGYVRDSRLDALAQAWAEQQYKNGAMSHNPNYASQMPGGWQRAGENVASGYTYDRVVPAWVASPSHYANLTNDYTSIGIGYYEANGKRYWAQEFAKYPGTAVPTKPATSTPPSTPAPPAVPPAAPPASGYPAEPAAPAGTLIALGSPSFEGSSSGWSGGAGVEGPTTAARGGRYDLKATGGTVSQTVNVAPRAGESYTATIWVKPGGASRIAGTVRLVAAGGAAETASVNFTASSGWMKVSVPLNVVRTGHTSLRIEVALNSGDIRLDSASLVRTRNAAPAPAPSPSTPPTTPPKPTPTPSPTKAPSSGGLLGGLLGVKPSTPAAPAPAPAPAPAQPAPAAPPAPAPAAPAAPPPAPPSGLGGLLSGLLGG